MNLMGLKPLALVMMMACCYVVHLSAFRSRLPAVTKIGSSSSLLLSSGVTRRLLTVLQLSATGSIIEVRKPTEAEVTRCQRWSTWGCGVSKFPWTYSDQETAYIISGKVEVTPTNGEPVLIQQGDLVVFPAGMSCTWHVLEDLMKHYSFD